MSEQEAPEEMDFVAGREAWEAGYEAGCRATVERMTTALIKAFPGQGSYNRTAIWQAIYRVRDEEAAR